MLNLCVTKCKKLHQKFLTGLVDHLNYDINNFDITILNHFEQVFIWIHFLVRDVNLGFKSICQWFYPSLSQTPEIGPEAVNLNCVVWDKVNFNGQPFNVVTY